LARDRKAAGFFYARRTDAPMADNDNGKIEVMSHQLVVIQTQMEQMVSFMARQTDAMERLARVEEREAAHTETVRRIWVELERQARLIEEQDKRIDELEKELNKRIGAIESDRATDGLAIPRIRRLLGVDCLGKSVPQGRRDRGFSAPIESLEREQHARGSTPRYHRSCSIGLGVPT
jgi:hypothetical protein